MEQIPYAFLLFIEAIALAGLAIVVQRKSGRTGLVILYLASAVILCGIGVVDWRRQMSQETPLAAYIWAAAGPTLLTIAFVRWASRKIGSSWITFVAAASLCLVSTEVGIFILTYLQ